MFSQNCTTIAIVHTRTFSSPKEAPYPLVKSLGARGSGQWERGGVSSPSRWGACPSWQWFCSFVTRLLESVEPDCLQAALARCGVVGGGHSRFCRVSRFLPASHTAGAGPPGGGPAALETAAPMRGSDLTSSGTAASRQQSCYLMSRQHQLIKEQLKSQVSGKYFLPKP